MRSDFKARRGLRALVIATAISLALGGTLAGVASASSPTNSQRAQSGAQWLANQLHKHHGVLVNFGVTDLNDTANAVIAMRAAGVDKHESDHAVRILRTKLTGALQSGGHDAPGALADWIMAAVSSGQDPRHFGGNGTRNNLVNRLLATARTSGGDAGLFGVQDPAFDGAFRQGLALAALQAARVAATDAAVAAGIAWLTNQQCANGLWQAYRAQTTTACPAADPNTFTGPDTNSTSLAVQGLAAWNQRPKGNVVLKSLKTIESSDAGFPFVAAKGQASDPNSTALVIQALLAEKSDPSKSPWKKGSHTPFTALASFQLGCKSHDNGAFVFPGSSSGNVFATVQAVPAMASKTLPVASSTKSVIVSLKPC